MFPLSLNKLKEIEIVTYILENKAAMKNMTGLSAAATGIKMVTIQGSTWDGTSTLVKIVKTPADILYKELLVLSDIIYQVHNTHVDGIYLNLIKKQHYVA